MAKIIGIDLGTTNSVVTETCGVVIETFSDSILDSAVAAVDMDILPTSPSISFSASVRRAPSPSFPMLLRASVSCRDRSSSFSFITVHILFYDICYLHSQLAVIDPGLDMKMHPVFHIHGKRRIGRFVQWKNVPFG